MSGVHCILAAFVGRKRERKRGKVSKSANDPEKLPFRLEGDDGDRDGGASPFVHGVVDPDVVGGGHPSTPSLQLRQRHSDARRKLLPGCVSCHLSDSTEIG